jgi:hypothetical protein
MDMEDFRILLSMAAVRKEGNHLEEAEEVRRIPDLDNRELGPAWYNNSQPRLGEWGFDIPNVIRVGSETVVVRRSQVPVVRNNPKLGDHQIPGDHQV